MTLKQLNRVLWHVTRSPLGPFYKQSLRLINNATVSRRRELAKQMPISQRSLAFAEQLERDGYVIITDAIDTGLLNELDAAAAAKISHEDRAAGNQSQTHKSFWTRLLDEDMIDGKLPISSTYARFATQPVVLEILTSTFGEIPFLDYVLLTLSRHTSNERSYSQLWHRDHDDTRVIKLFVYLTNVIDENDGPFTFIPGPVSDRYGFSRHSHRDDVDVFLTGLATPADVKSMIAPKLSVFMVETSRCLHMGSRVAPDHSRLLYTATYLKLPSMFPGRTNKFSPDIKPRDQFEQALLNF